MPTRLSKTLTLLSLMAVLLTAFTPYQPIEAVPEALAGSSAVPGLSQFIQHVVNGQAEELRGVFIPRVMAARIVQQPNGHNEFISPREGILTQFGLSSEYGATGLLAHNYLAGEKFSLLEPGKVFYLVYGDGKVSRFVVREVERYQALDPLSLTSRFVSLQDKSLFSATELFERVFNRPGQVIFQTCIAKGGESSWGRLFIIAEPLSAR